MENAIAFTIFGVLFAVGAPVIYVMQQALIPTFREPRHQPFLRTVRNLFVVAGLLMAAVGAANLLLGPN